MPTSLQSATSATVASGGLARGLRRLSFPALGTTCEIQYEPVADPAQNTRFELRAVGWVEQFEARYSRFRPDSLVSRINAVAGYGWVKVDAEAEQLFQLCDSMFTLTGGILDPTALPLIRLWNWREGTVPGNAQVEQARSLVGWKKVQRRNGEVFLPQAGMALDFGGFGKEFAVDLVAQSALDHGIANVLVDFGHDIRVLGTPPGRAAWHIGIEDPLQPGQQALSLAVPGSRGVASSGDYVRCFRVGNRRYGHIIDPRTGYPVDNGCMQVTVIAGTCLQAGVLSTTAFVLGVEEGRALIQNFPRAEGLLVTDRVRAQTRGFHSYVAI